jgi:hypothetical protein
MKWDNVTETTQFLDVTGERIPITVEGMRYLAAKFEALQLDYNYLVEEIRELEFATRTQDLQNGNFPNPHIFQDPY